MISIIKKSYKLNITSNLKKSLTSFRKDKLKSFFESFKMNRINDDIIEFRKEDEQILLNGKTTLIKSQDYLMLKKYCVGVLNILDIDDIQDQIEITVECLINGKEENMEIGELSNILDMFFGISESDEIRVINKIEYLTIINNETNKAGTIKFNLYKNGLVASASTLVDNINEIKIMIDDLNKKIDNSIIKVLNEKLGE